MSIFEIEMRLLPILLAIETSGPLCSIALSGADGQVFLLEEIGDRIHGERIILLIQQILKEAKISASDLAAVAVSAGPGSFTGLRIGLSTAKGLCYALGIPLILLPTLECLGREAQVRADAEQAIVLIEARVGEWYSARVDASGVGVMLSRSLEEIEELVAEGKGKAVMAGPGLESIPALTVDVPMLDSIELSAQWVLTLGLEYFHKGKFADLILSEPIYVKPVRITQDKHSTQV